VCSEDILTNTKKGGEVMGNILRGKIIERFGTLSRFAAAMRMNPASLSWRLTGRAEWKRDEIVKAVHLLGIHPANIALYFFPECLESTSTRTDA